MQVWSRILEGCRPPSTSHSSALTTSASPQSALEEGQQGKVSENGKRVDDAAKGPDSAWITAGTVARQAQRPEASGGVCSHLRVRVAVDHCGLGCRGATQLLQSPETLHPGQALHKLICVSDGNTSACRMNQWYLEGCAGKSLPSQ